MIENYDRYVLSMYQVRGRLLNPIQELRFPQPKNFKSFPIFLEELRKLTAFHARLPKEAKYSLVKAGTHFTMNLYDANDIPVASITYSPQVVHPYIQLMNFDVNLKGLTKEEFEELKYLYGKVRWEDSYTPNEEFRYTTLLHYCSEEQAVQCMEYESNVIKEFRVQSNYSAL